MLLWARKETAKSMNELGSQRVSWSVNQLGNLSMNQ